MSVSLSIEEFVHDPARHLRRVARRRERLVLSRGDVPVAEVAPAETGDATLRVGDLPAVMDALPKLFEEEADAFAGDLDAARRSTSPDRLRDPWAS